MEYKYGSACQTAEAVCRREITARQLIEETLERCSRINETLNAFITCAGPEALQAADAVDAKVKSGLSLPLAGVSLAVKDNFSTSALKTSFGSPAFSNFTSPYNATAVEKLTAAGAIVIGKSNLDDMGIGSTTATSPDGPTLNPWNKDYLAGSAGSAAVASGLCLLSLESDTGGALRQGASHCGTFGLRPTMGRVSRYGLNLFSASFAQPGLSAVSAADIRIALKIISGFDERDAATTVCKDKQHTTGKAHNSQELKIGFPVNVAAMLSDDQRALFEHFRSRFEAEEYKLIDCNLNLLAEGLRAYYVIAFIEASSTLSRFDGIRFGTAAEAESLDELYFKSRGATFGREARRRSVFGTYLLSQGSYDRYYRQALKVWDLVKQEFDKIFSSCDLLLMPAVKAGPNRIKEAVDFLKLYEDDLFCAPVSMAGLPSLCLPSGKICDMPVGVQLVGPPFSEELLFAVAARIVPEIEMPGLGFAEGGKS